MRPLVILEPIIAASGNVASYCGPILLEHLTAEREAGRTVPPEAEEFIEKLHLLGIGWNNGHVANVARRVALLDGRDGPEVQWISVKDTTNILDISRQAVAGLIDRGTLHGETVNGHRRVCADSVRARKEGTKCPH